MSSIPLARMEYVDLATGRPVHPHESIGSAATGRYVVELDGVEVEIDEADLMGIAEGERPRDRRYRVDPEAIEEAKETVRARHKVTKTKRPRGPRATFGSAKEAADIFYTANEDYFDHVHDLDGLADWMDGIEVHIGRSTTTKRLAKTPTGQRILAQQPAVAITQALAYILGKARGRRWDAVEWHEVERLGDALYQDYEPPTSGPTQPGIYWWPLHKPSTSDLGELDADQQAQVIETENANTIAEALEELQEAFAANQHCIPAELHAIVTRRIEEWTRWVDDPANIPDYACEPDMQTGGYTCHYPSVTGELRELVAACERPYDPDWSEADANAATPGFPDTSHGPNDEPEPEPEAFEPEPEHFEPEPPFDAEHFDPEPEPEHFEPEPPFDAEHFEPEPPFDAEHFEHFESEPEPEPEHFESEPEPEPGKHLQLASDGRAFGGPSNAIVEAFDRHGILYQREYRTCGKRHPVTGQSWCRCGRPGASPSDGHGPYWYAYFHEGLRRRSRYIGKELPNELPKELPNENI